MLVGCANMLCVLVGGVHMYRWRGTGQSSHLFQCSFEIR